MGLLANLQVSGDLAGLVREFLQEHEQTQSELYRYLSGVSANSRMPFQHWWAVLDELQTMFSDRYIGIELGCRIRADFVGVLGHLLLSSENLTDALQGFQRYQRLLHDGDRAVVTAQDGLICMSWTTDYGASSRLSDEILVVGIIHFARTLVADGSLSPERIHFTFNRPPEAESLQQVCGCDVKFSQRTTAICFRPDQMLLPVCQSNPSMHRLLEQQAQALMGILPDEDAFTLSLREALLAAIRQGQPDAAFVARFLHISERTLFRRLKAGGLNFSDVMTQVRMQLAREYLLEGHLTQSEIALLLGYSEQSAFNRAFKQNTGLPPGSWVKTQQA
ncbi:MAG: hypothetical protein CMI02_06805 [Oceanospirillaceae bacterium]|nr:hypothetical protein [Oceanospirillaceae bacterium]MBT11726.1 hypothetical protein [Oceanospirillaceae bacterium]|tara:strand:+ start:106838 stop:107839 length:1002 start_codon:yes stop_codon:yes gene_type:complete